MDGEEEAGPLAGPDGQIRRYRHDDFSPDELTYAKKDRSLAVHVVIPARNEEGTIGEIAGAVRCELMEYRPLVDSLVVVDDASLDDTAMRAHSSGAEVVRGPGLGKGEAMAAALSHLEASRDDVVVFLDGDVVGFEAHFVTGILGPLLLEPAVELVKGAYARPAGPGGLGGGRVTELVAKPTLSLLFPELSGLSQPLAGETGIRVGLLREIGLADGYAVEVAMLIDAWRRKGMSAIAEVDLGERRHRNRPLEELVPQARQVLTAILERSGALGRELS